MVLITEHNNDSVITEIQTVECILIQSCKCRGSGEPQGIPFHVPHQLLYKHDHMHVALDPIVPLFCHVNFVTFELSQPILCFQNIKPTRDHLSMVAKQFLIRANVPMTNSHLLPQLCHFSSLFNTISKQCNGVNSDSNMNDVMATNNDVDVITLYNT
jgi:hypothetical protein